MMLAVLAMMAAIIACAFMFHVFARFEKRLHDQSGEINRQMDRSLGSVQEQMRHFGEMFQRTQSSIGDRLDGASRLVGEVQNRLGQLEQANQRILDLGSSLGREVGSLQSILQAPKIRGGLGEYFLGDLLEQVLGAEFYSLQYPFKKGERVDAVVRLAQGLIPIDAKFPLENFRRSLSADSDNEKKSFRKEFLKDVRKHIDQIADKYLVPDEGTLDFALMYIPAENVYYETIVRDEDLGEKGSLSEYAQNKKVIPVSPNTLYIYLSSIARGLQGLKIESHAQEILENIQRLSVDLEKFDDEYRKMGGHLKNSLASYERAARVFERLQDRFLLSQVVENAAEIKIQEEKI
jgi:DNA recombination protein RmuC